MGPLTVDCLRVSGSLSRLPETGCVLSMIIIIIVIQKEVAGSASGGCAYGMATGQTLGGVRSRPTTEEEVMI